MRDAYVGTVTHEFLVFRASFCANCYSLETVVPLSCVMTDVRKAVLLKKKENAFNKYFMGSA